MSSTQMRSARISLRIARVVVPSADEDFLDQLTTIPGGKQARGAIRPYLDKYGMRGVGEIDITRARWSEHPTTLLPVILGHIRNFEPGAAARHFEHGRQEASRGTGGTGAPAGLAGRRAQGGPGPADDRPRPDVHRVMAPRGTSRSLLSTGVVSSAVVRRAAVLARRYHSARACDIVRFRVRARQSAVEIAWRMLRRGGTT
jgi:hypothetical protein